MMSSTTTKPTIVKEKDYVLIGSVDHGMQIPQDSMLELIASLRGVSALMMETPEEYHETFHPMSTEILTKVSVGKMPTEYLSGNRLSEDIGSYVTKYAPVDLAEVFVPCNYIRIAQEEGINFNLEMIINFATKYKQRFGFIDVKRSVQNCAKLIQYWDKNKLDQTDLDYFSYDFEKFVGDIREFELWKPELQSFRNKYPDKIAVCVGNYHVPFVNSVLEGKEMSAPDWKTHIDMRREDKHTPQDACSLKKIYENIDKALNS